MSVEKRYKFLIKSFKNIYNFFQVFFEQPFFEYFQIFTNFFLCVGKRVNFFDSNCLLAKKTEVSFPFLNICLKFRTRNEKVLPTLFCTVKKKRNVANFVAA